MILRLDRKALVTLLLHPPAMGACAFALLSSLYTLTKPGGWYFPLIHEAMAFLLSFLPLAALNALVFLPAAFLLTAKIRPSMTVAAGYVASMALSAALIAYLGEWVGRRPSIFHVAILTGALLPGLAMAIGTWRSTVAYRAAQQPATTVSSQRTSRQ